MQPGARGGILSQLYEVIVLLASENGRIEERLAHAYVAHIQSMDAGGLAPDAQFKFEWIRAELKALYPAPDNAAGVDPQATVAIAQSIILLYDALNP